MPLVKSPSKEAFSANVSAERAAGKPMKQALAIAYSVKRRAGKYAEGGEVEETERPRIVVPYYDKPEPPAEEPYNPWERVAPKMRASVYGKPSEPLTVDPIAVAKGTGAVASGFGKGLTKGVHETAGESLKDFYGSLYGFDLPEGHKYYDDAGRVYDAEGKELEVTPKSQVLSGMTLLGNASGSTAGMVGLAGMRGRAAAEAAAGEFKTGIKYISDQIKAAAPPSAATIPIAPQVTKNQLILKPQKPAPKVLEPKKPLMMEDGYLDSSNLVPYGPNLGTNPGSFARDSKTGIEYYLKHPPSEDAAKNEVLASKIYELMGIPVADVSLTHATNGKLAIASKIVPGEQLSKFKGNYADLEHLQENVVADAWLKNWDSVGIGPENPYGNVMWKDGKAVRIDTGGALRYRGRGDLKANPYGGDVISDLATMMLPHKQSGKIFYDASAEAIKKGAERVASVPDAALDALIAKFGPDDPMEQLKLYSDLVQRKNAIAKHFGVGEYAPKPKGEPFPKEEPPAAKAPSFDDLKDKVKAEDAATDFLRSLGHPQHEIDELTDSVGHGDVVALAKAAGMADDIVAAKIPPMPKATMEPTTKKVSLAGGTINYAGGGEFLGKMGPNLYGLAKAGQLSAKDVKGLVGKLTKPSVDPIDAAGAIWDVAVVNPHSGEALFRALPNETKAFVGYMLKDFTSGGGGKSPFDNLTKVPGKFLFSHTSDPKFWGPKVPKKAKIKTAKDYTDKDIEDYYASLDDQADKEHAIAKGEPAIGGYKPKYAEVGEVMDPYGDMPAASSEQWDKFLHVIPDFRKFKPDWEDLHKKIEFPRAENDPYELGFHTQLKLFKGGSKKDPEVLRNPPKGHYGEPSTSLSDSTWIAGKYDKGAGISEYVVAPKKAMEIDYPKINGGSAGYSGVAVRRALLAAKHRGADLVVMRNMEDVGSYAVQGDHNPHGLQTQYHVLDTSILRNPNAKFATKNLGKAWPMAGVAGGFLVVHGKDEGADKMKRGGGVGKLESALRVAKKYASGGPLDLMADKNDTNQFLPHTKGILASTVPGRTDKLPIKVKPGSYVIPADILSSSALGQGNTLAGSKMLDIGLAKHRTGPRMGMFAGMGQHSMRSPTARAKSATPKLAQHSGQKRIPGMKQFAEGGEVDDGIPIIAAGGEYLVEPEVVQSIGGGDVQQGHDILDKFVKKVRAHNIKTLKALPGPKRS